MIAIEKEEKNCTHIQNQKKVALAIASEIISEKN